MNDEKSLLTLLMGLLGQSSAYLARHSSRMAEFVMLGAVHCASARAVDR